VVIRTPEQRLRVFVSSTLGELADERRAVARAISALRLTPVLFESGARPHPPQQVYRAYLSQSDVFIGLYWQRYGWVGPGMQISGLEEELTLARDLPRLLYVKGPAPEREPRLAEMLARIRDEATESYRHFRTARELGRLVRDDLATLLSERFAVGRSVATEAEAVVVAGSGPVAARHGPRPLPAAGTSLVGREEAIDEVAGLLGEPEVRLVTLTGPGGVGKTRLALAVAERLRSRFDAGTVFVPLAGVTRPELVLAGIGRAAGAEVAGAGAPLEVLVEHFADGRWLLVLDNLEQVVEVAGDLAELLPRSAGLVILATSRTALGLRAEHEYQVPPLPLPADGPMSVEALAAVPAVALFVDRAQAVRPDFTLTAGNAAAVAEICRRLEGLPLAIELAAARTRLLDPDALLRRLAGSLDVLSASAVDLPERQRTLRATVEWSVGLLDDAERSLAETTAIFVDGWTIAAAADVAGLDEDRTLELTEGLDRHSLVQLDHTDLGLRCRMLETIRAFVAERLAARPDAAEIGRRHADHYRELAEQADRPLRGTGQREWVERLEAESGNLAAAVRWYLAHDPRPVPHLFRVLWPFWSQRDHLGEARAWIEQLLPTAESLDAGARAELLWTAVVTAREVGDDRAALAARRRLAPLLASIDDPYLHAASQLAMAWTSPIVDDLDGALREALASLEEFRGHDEPLGTASAGLTVGSLETTLGRYDDALPYLTDARDLADRLDNAWLAATARVLLAILALVRGRRDDARTLLDRGLDLSLAADSTQLVTLCLATFARLAFVEGDPERAALLAGAAEGLRRRIGLQAWPSHRRSQAELVAQVRQALGAARLDQVFAAGARLTRREAVAAVRDWHRATVS
jgi:predicted ATPase